MPHYDYTAVDIAGKSVSGSMEAASQQQLIRTIKDKNLYVLSIEDKADKQQKKADAANPKIKTKILAIFCRQFATLINAGVTAVKSLDILYQQTEDKNMKLVLGKIYEGVQKGEALSESFRRQGMAFPELFNNMILAGETSGNLDAVLIRLADHFERENKLNNKIRSSMVYPIILSVVTVVVVIIMLVFVLPTFTDILLSSGAEVPVTTQILINVSDFIKKFWWLLAGMLVIAIIGWRGFTRSDKGRLWWDTKKLGMPVIGKSVKMIYTARFARTLSTLLSSGIQMLPALDITSRVLGNTYLQEKLVTVMEDIRKGVSLSLSLKRVDQFPPMIFNMVNVGEESGLLDDILEKTAAFYDEESESAIQKMVGLIEPALLIVMAVVIGFIVVSIYLPMTSIYNAIG